MDGYRRAISKTPQYIEFHASRIEKGQRVPVVDRQPIYRFYLLAMMSTFESDFEENVNLWTICCLIVWLRIWSEGIRRKGIAEVERSSF